MNNNIKCVIDAQAVPSEVSTEGKYDIKVLHTPIETADIAVE